MTEIVDPIDMLVATEEVKRLRCVFSMLQDSQDWAGLHEMFVDGATVVLEKESIAGDSVPRREEVTADDLVERIRTRSTGHRRFHALHSPAIEVTSPTTARGLWPFSSGSERGFYDDHYVKLGGAWKIERTRIIVIIAHDPAELTAPDGGQDGVRPLWDSLAAWK